MHIVEGAYEMMLASSQISMSFSSWKNPYVTSGLMAMWDGEWNAGPGKHDANSTTWIDVMNNAQTSTLPSGWYFGENMLYVTSASSLTFPTSFYQTYTIEYVFKTVQYMNECLFESLGANSSFRLKLTTGNGLQVYFNHGYLTLDVATFTETETPISIASSVVNQQTEGIVIAYKNGVQTKNGTLQSPSSTVDTPSWSIGRPSSNFGVKQECYAFRLYNRALSPNEIAANYAIDKERFNMS